MGRNLFYEKRSSPYPSSKSLDDGINEGKFAKKNYNYTQNASCNCKLRFLLFSLYTSPETGLHYLHAA